jgi:hypothetical protein
MANRNSEKGSEHESRTGQGGNENANNHKLPDNPDRNPEELISSRGDTSNGKDSKTGKRKDEIDQDYTRGGK